MACVWQGTHGALRKDPGPLCRRPPRAVPAAPAVNMSGWFVTIEPPPLALDLWWAEPGDVSHGPEARVKPAAGSRVRTLLERELPLEGELRDLQDDVRLGAGDPGDRG